MGKEEKVQNLHMVYIYDDLKAHAGLENAGLLQVQGKVTDGQYINVPFLTAMNQTILDLLSKILPPEDLELLKQDIWWECQWDPGHWLDKVFSSLKENELLSRLELHYFINFLDMEKCILLPRKPLKN